MSAAKRNLESGCYWYPFRPWLRWPLLLLAIAGTVFVVVKLVAHPHWSDLVEFIGPAWLLLATLDAPQPRPKTPGILRWDRASVGCGRVWFLWAFGCSDDKNLSNTTIDCREWRQRRKRRFLNGLSLKT